MGQQLQCHPKSANTSSILLSPSTWLVFGTCYSCTLQPERNIPFNYSHCYYISVFDGFPLVCFLRFQLWCATLDWVLRTESQQRAKPSLLPPPLAVCNNVIMPTVPLLRVNLFSPLFLYFQICIFSSVLCSCWTLNLKLISAGGVTKIPSINPLLEKNSRR